jgi:hypothetical protein
MSDGGEKFTSGYGPERPIKYDRFKMALDGRLALWKSVIDAANLDEPAKDIFRKVLARQGKNAELYFQNPDPEGDFVFGTINLLLNAKGDAIVSGASEGEVNALVANLKSDIWAFYSEITNQSHG